MIENGNDDAALTESAAVEALAESLRGADVEMDVETSDGRRHVARRLDGVTIDPRRDLISGFDPLVGAVRSFRLSRVTRLVAAGVPS